MIGHPAFDDEGCKGPEVALVFCIPVKRLIDGAHRDDPFVIACGHDAAGDGGYKPADVPLMGSKKGLPFGGAFCRCRGRAVFSCTICPFCRHLEYAVLLNKSFQEIDHLFYQVSI